MRGRQQARKISAVSCCGNVACTVNDIKERWEGQEEVQLLLLLLLLLRLLLLLLALILQPICSLADEKR